MKIVVASILWSVSFCVVGAVVCNETCSYSQLCGKDGICYERSELVKCSSWKSSYMYVHYCKKGQECCGSKCMPLGADCCSASEYCANASTCCAGDLCCSPGLVCESGACVVKKKEKQEDKHDNGEHDSRSAKFTWWQILLILAVCVAVFFAVLIWKRRYTRIKANNQTSRVVMVLGAPVNTSMQSTSVHI